MPSENHTGATPATGRISHLIQNCTSRFVPDTLHLHRTCFLRHFPPVHPSMHPFKSLEQFSYLQLHQQPSAPHIPGTPESLHGTWEWIHMKKIFPSFNPQVLHPHYSLPNPRCSQTAFLRNCSKNEISQFSSRTQETWDWSSHTA